MSHLKSSSFSSSPFRETKTSKTFPPVGGQINILLCFARRSECLLIIFPPSGRVIETNNSSVALVEVVGVVVIVTQINVISAPPATTTSGSWPPASRLTFVSRSSSGRRPTGCGTIQVAPKGAHLDQASGWPSWSDAGLVAVWPPVALIGFSLVR